MGAPRSEQPRRWLGTLLAACLATLRASSACPRPCACPGPAELHCTFRYLWAVPPRIPRGVRRINLGYNSLRTLSPADFAGLESLELLMLHSNEISTIPERVFGDLRSLQVLKMSYNKVRVLQQDVFHGLSSLVRLHMDHNQIEFVHPYVFHGLTSLRSVHLDGNLLQQLHPDTFVTLHYSQIFQISFLRHISLADNALTSLPAEMFSYLAELESLYLHGNPWSCDCSLRGFAEWARDRADVLKCRKERISGAQQCPVCASPKNHNGKSLADLPPASLTCFKPVIDDSLKSRNLTLPDDGDVLGFASPRDFLAPIGSVVLNVTDQAGNRGNLACHVQKPRETSPASFQQEGTVLKSSFSAFLVCGIGDGDIQQLWSILALYSTAPLKLERTTDGAASGRHRYKQIHPEKDELFTNIEAELRAEPGWLAQNKVTLQLDRTATTLSALHLRFSADVQIRLPADSTAPVTKDWVTISRDSSTPREHTVLVGDSVELGCRARGHPAPITEWVLSDGSRARAPHVSEDGRTAVLGSGSLTLRSADTFDTGLYRCVSTNGRDTAALALRVTVLEPRLERRDLNGARLWAAPGSTLHLPCTATAAPDPAIAWVLPEGSILRHSAGNKEVLANGTLRIRGVSERDAGFFRCVAANPYGADLLVFQVLVRRGGTAARRKQGAEGDGEEGSGGAGLGSAGAQSRTLDTPRAHGEPSSRGARQRNGHGNTPHQPYSDRTGWQLRGQRRQFVSSGRRADPQRWAALVERTRRNRTATDRGGDGTAEPPVHIQKISEAPEDGEETSGDLISPEEFMIPATERSPGFALGTATELTVTAGPQEPPNRGGKIPLLLTETFTPLPSPPAASGSGKSQTKPTVRWERSGGSRVSGNGVKQTSAASGTATLSPAVQGVMYSEESNKQNLKSVTPTTRAAGTGEAGTPQNSADNSRIFTEAVAEVSTTAGQQVPVVTVSTPSPESGPVYFHKVQRGEAPKPPPASTVPSHQQTRVFQDIPTQPPQLQQRRGRRRKISGRRRIVRPGRVPGVRPTVIAPKTDPKITKSKIFRGGGRRGQRRKRPPKTPAPQRVTAATPAGSRATPTVTAVTPPAVSPNPAEPPPGRVSAIPVTKAPSLRVPVTPGAPQPGSTAATEPLVTQRDSQTEMSLPGSPAAQTPTLALSPAPVQQRNTPLVTSPAQTPTPVQNRNTPLATSPSQTPTPTFPLTSDEQRDTSLATSPPDSPAQTPIPTFPPTPVQQTDTPLATSPAQTPSPALQSSPRVDKPPGATSAGPAAAGATSGPAPAQPTGATATAGERSHPKPGHGSVPEQQPAQPAGPARPVPSVPVTVTAPSTRRPSPLPAPSVAVPPGPAVPASSGPGGDRKPPPVSPSSAVPASSGPGGDRKPRPVPPGTAVPASSGTGGQTKPRPVSRPEGTERDSTLTARTVTARTVTAPRAPLTAPPRGRDTDSSGQGGSGRTQQHRDPTTTTPNPVSSGSASGDRFSKPRIVGGNLAAFTLLADSDAFIPCEATGNPPPVIEWTKVPSGSDAPGHGGAGRWLVLANGTLSIPRAGPEDSGQYQCTAANEHGSARLLVTLAVLAIPPRLAGGPQRLLTAHSGSSVAVPCRAEGRPAPSISWLLANGTRLSRSSSSWGKQRAGVEPDGTLVIRAVSVFDRGLYTCLAQNAAGTAAVAVRLQVVAAPPSILEERRQSVVAAAGQSLELPCTAQGKPEPAVHWVLPDGAVLTPLRPPRSGLSVLPDGTLRLGSIAPAHSGTYECIATSSTGSDRRVVVLAVQRRDALPKIAAASAELTRLRFGERLLLNCTASGDPEPRIIWRLPSRAVVDQWHRMGSRIHVYPNGSLAIEAVTEKDAGDYVCVARNRVGDDVALMRVGMAMEPAKIEHRQQLRTRVPYGEDFRADCKASGWPVPRVSWALPDGTRLSSAGHSGLSSSGFLLLDNGTLLLRRAGLAHAGLYTCYAHNALGSAEMRIQLTVVAAAPRIKHKDKTRLTVTAGDAALLDCEADGEPRPRISWLLPSGETLSSSAERLSLHPNGSLTIGQAGPPDAGQYVCAARNAGGADTKLYELRVAPKAPTINGLHGNRTVVKVTAVRHSKKHIECRAEGTPPPRIAWVVPDNIFLTAPYYGSRIAVHQNGTLEIRNVRPSDAAEFVCVARNEGGEAALVVRLEVTEMLRRPTFKNPLNERIVAKPGRAVTLNCSVDGNPPPDVSWMLPNGTWLSSGTRTPRFSTGSDGTLSIPSPERPHAGRYRCAARNQVGYIEKLLVLEVAQKPRILTGPAGLLKGVSGEPLSLHCAAEGSPKPRVEWTLPDGRVLQRPQLSGRFVLLENGTLLIRAASALDAGNYHCRAHNDAGAASLAVAVAVTSRAPRIVARAPPAIRTAPGAALQLHCVVLGIPTPEITWRLPDGSVLSTARRGTAGELLHPTGTLLLRNPRPSDSGAYECTASSPLGTETAVTYLHVL